MAATGVLTFNAAPDFENPLDADADNIYAVQVTVTDSGGLTDVQNLQVTVTDVNEFTDDPLIPDTTVIMAVHFTELRERINAQLVRFS